MIQPMYWGWVNSTGNPILTTDLVTWWTPHAYIKGDTAEGNDEFNEPYVDKHWCTDADCLLFEEEHPA